MQGLGEFEIPRGDRHDRTESHRGKVTAAIRGLLHDAGRGVGIVRHHDASAGRNMEVAEKVALAEGRDEQLLGIPPIGVAVEDPV